MDFTIHNILIHNVKLYLEILPVLYFIVTCMKGAPKSLVTRISEWFLIIAAVILICITAGASFLSSDTSIPFRDLLESGSVNPFR